MGFLGRILDKSIVFSFDKTGYERHARTFDERGLDVDMRGRICLVTGASSGLGIEVTRGLVERGAEVHLLCRNVPKGERVAGELRAAGVAGSLTVRGIDLSDIDPIRRRRHDRLARGS